MNKFSYYRSNLTVIGIGIVFLLNKKFDFSHAWMLISLLISVLVAAIISHVLFKKTEEKEISNNASWMTFLALLIVFAVAWDGVSKIRKEVAK